MCACLFIVFSLVSVRIVCGGASGRAAHMQSNLRFSECSHAITVGISAAAFWKHNGARVCSCLPISLINKKKKKNKATAVSSSSSSSSQHYAHLHLVYVIIVFASLCPSNQPANAFLVQSGQCLA